MSNFIQWLTSFLKKDELYGTWQTEDGTGFSMIMGSWIEFKTDGKGKYESWSNSNDGTGYDSKGEINWKRIDKINIEITELPEFKKEIISYKLEKVNNRIELSNLTSKKVGNIEITGFWNFAQVLFKT